MTENLQNQTEQLDGQQQYEKIISLKEQGYTYEQIAEEMGIGSKGTVSKIIKRFEGVSDTKETEKQTAEITKEPIRNLHVNTSSRKNVKTIFTESRIKQEDEEQKETFERPEVRNVTTTPTAKSTKTVCTIPDGVRLSKSINK